VWDDGSDLGNYNTQQHWVTVAEWMQTNPPRPSDYTVCMKHGSDNAVVVARIQWDRPNRTWDTR